MSAKTVAIIVLLVIVAGLLGYIFGHGGETDGGQTTATNRAEPTNPFSRAMQEGREHNPFSEAMREGMEHNPFSEAMNGKGGG